MWAQKFAGRSRDGSFNGKTQRICATMSWHLVHRLEERAAYEGRSLSNLIAHLLEAAD